MNRNLHHARKRRQLQHALKRARRAFASSQGQLTPQLLELKDRIQRLIASLRGAVSVKEMARMAGGLAAMLGLAIAPAVAQNFIPAAANPFGLGNNNGVVSDYQLVDLDGDGDLDLIGHGFGYGTYYSYYGLPITFQENSGTPNAPSFDPPVNEAFASNLNYDGWDVASFYGGLTLEVADLDGDGDYDLLAIERYGYAFSYSYTGYDYGYFLNPVIWIENTGTPTSPQFQQASVNPFGLDFQALSLDGDVAIIGVELMDVDGDGDLDLLGIQTLVYSYLDGPEHGFFWCENTGTADAPAFAAPSLEPFGLHGMADSNGSGLAFHLDAADLDNDGDIDLLESVYFEGVDTYYLTELHYIENIGSSSAPSFAEPILSPFGLMTSPISGICFTEFADLDGDGDYDAVHNMLSDYIEGNLPTLWYQENLGGVNDVPSVPEGSEAMLAYPNPVSAGAVLHLAIPEGAQEGMECTWIDLTGQIVHQSTLPSAGREQVISTDGLAAGTYQLQVQLRGAAPIVQRIVIQ